MTDLASALRDDLGSALRERDRQTVRVLRTVLSAIANAEAQPQEDPTPLSAGADGPIAGAASGVGAAEVQRRSLDPATIRGIVATERDERLAVADDLEDRGAADAARDLRAEAELLSRYLD